MSVDGEVRLRTEADDPGWEVDPDDEWGVAVVATVGRQLKLRREAVGMRAAEFARAVGYGEDLVYKIESGKRIPRPEYLDKADEVLGAGGLISAMKEDVAKVRYPKKVRDLAQMEARAVEIGVYENSIIAGLLHSDQPKSGGLMRNSGRQDIKKLLNMQYYATQLAVDGMRSVLRGPGHLHDDLGRDMPAARARAADFPETHVYRPGDADTPYARGGRALPLLKKPNDYPTGLKLAAFTLRMVPQHWRRTVSEDDARTPELEYAKADALWWRIPHHSSVIVGAADGSGKMWYRHDREKFRRLLQESRALTREIEQNWDRLAAEYRAALPTITSVEEWKRTFEGR